MRPGSGTWRSRSAVPVAAGPIERALALRHQPVHRSVLCAEVQLAVRILTDRARAVGQRDAPVLLLPRHTGDEAEAADPGGAEVRVEVEARDAGDRPPAIDAAAD